MNAEMADMKAMEMATEAEKEIILEWRITPETMRTVQGQYGVLWRMRGGG